MNKLLPYIFGVLLAGFVIGVAAAVLYYSWNALGIIFPNDLLGQSFGIMLFDIAAFIWFGVLVYLARSTMQYVWSAFGFLIGLFGSLGLIAIEVGLNSEIFTREDIAKPLTYIFIAVMFAHLILIYARHASAPEVSADISLGIEKAKITDEAMKQAEKQLQDNLPLLASSIANDLVKRVMQDLNLIPASNQVIDLPALDVKDSSLQNGFRCFKCDSLLFSDGFCPKCEERRPMTNADNKKVDGGATNFLLKYFPFLGNAARKNGFNVMNADVNFNHPIQKPSPAPTDAGSDAVAEEKAKV